MPNKKHIQELKDKRPHKREEAAYFLGKAQAPDAVDDLIRLLQDDNLFVARAAVKALGQIGDKKALPKLEHILTQSTKLTGFLTEKDFLHECATMAIKRINKEEFRAKVDVILNKKIPDKHDMKELGDLGDERAVPFLKRYAAPSDSKFEWDGKPRRTGDDDWRDFEALLALAKIEGERSISFIVQFFDFYGTGFRYGLPTNYFAGMAVAALGKVGPAAVPELADCVARKRQIFADDLMKALQDIGLSAVPFLIKLVKKKYMCSEAIGLLKLMRDPRAIPVLQKTFHGSDGRLIQEAANALKSFDVPENNIDVDEILYLLKERIPNSTATHPHSNKYPKLRNYWPYSIEDKAFEFLPEAVRFRSKGYDFRIHHLREQVRNVSGDGKRYRRYDQLERIKIVSHVSDQPILSKSDIRKLIEQRLPQEHHKLISDEHLTRSRRLYEAYGDFTVVYHASEEHLNGRALKPAELKWYLKSKNIVHVPAWLTIEFPSGQG